MVLENFKSYAGTKEIGPFHKVSLISIKEKKKITGGNQLDEKITPFHCHFCHFGNFFAIFFF